MTDQLYRQAAFLTSAASLKQLPSDQGMEIAFVGRSNAGKSSALNTLTHQKQLARTSKTPGRTQLINLFKLDETRRLVDLPGYGYAKVPAETQSRWQALLGTYLTERDCLRGLILLVDVRHLLFDSDWNMIDWASQAGLPVHILLTKSDKLSQSARHKQLKTLQTLLTPLGETVTCQLFSSLKKTGLDILYRQLDQWFKETP